ncbi:MAG TPA: hypothetical protein VLN48_21170, partial [Bryobacteraceae bacterium]|nr:hypothetical protein [Bryobacteraceae bacterium]
DFDYNRNGIRDETPASTSDMTRSAVIGMLQQFRAVNGDLQLVMGNSGYLPELNLTPYVNGYVLECVSDAWNSSNLSQASAAGWRGVFDAYRAMQATSRRPRINLLEGCGAQDKRSNPSYLTFTADDLRTHRMTLGTALLSDGFYSFDLHDNFTVPLWYDEYSVDAKGNAVEDRTKKGYLGAALTDAVELTDGGSVVLQESFEGAILPSAFRANPASAVSVSNGALIITNSDHTQNGSVGVSTNPSTLRLDPGTYLLTFDWKVLETLDHPLSFNVRGSRQLDSFRVPWVVTGDFGTVHFPFVISSSDAWSIGINMSGGGKVAIDNIGVVRGGVGPWRRDFENGFVLVNPLPQPRTFSATELAGTLNRTVIHRIKGTQAPDVNNGQPVTGDLTLGAFDAIILLADHIGAPQVKVPNIALVANAFGDTPLIAPNTWVEIKGTHLAPAGDTRIWQASDFAANHLPLQLDGVSVAVNGRVAYPYFISPTQVNILTPPYSLSGPVQVQLTSGGVTSNVFSVQAQPQSLSFFEFVHSSGRHYVYGRHVGDNTIIGPTNLFPGLTTPVKPGETVYIAGNGFPATDVPVVDGALTQAGTLPAPWPLVQIGGVPATVLFAGLVAPGTYIFNIIVPPTVLDGDNILTATYNGLNTQANLYVAIQH